MPFKHSTYNSSVKSISQYRKCLHRDVASTVRIITVHKIHNNKQLLKIKKIRATSRYWTKILELSHTFYGKVQAESLKLNRSSLQ